MSGNVVIPFDGDFESLRSKLAAWGFETGSRPNAPLFARGPGVTIHAYRTGKLLLAGARADEWAARLRGEPATATATAPAAASDAEWVIHFDGGCEPVNPGGIAGYGYQVLHRGRVAHEASGLAAPPGPGATNNVAEFTAVIEGLRWMKAQGHRAPLLRGDSLLVVDALRGRKTIRAPHLVPLYEEAARLLRETEATVEWVPREKNAEADRLAAEGARDAARKHPEWRIRL